MKTTNPRTQKPIIFISALLAMLFLCSCGSSHYGVPDEEWLQMSEAEKVAVIQGYNERQRIREQRRLEEEKRNRRAQEQQDKMRREYVAAIYSGNRGQLGDLLRVSMKNGEVRIAGKHRPYRPVSFKIADQECKAVPLTYEKKYYSYSGKLNVCYADGTLLLDTGRSTSHGATAITYDPAWIKGKTYTGISSNGQTEIRQVNIQIVAISSQRNVTERITW